MNTVVLIVAKGDSWLAALAYVFVCLYITMSVTGLGFMIGIRQSVRQHGINHYEPV